MRSNKSVFWCAFALSLAPSLAGAQPLSQWAKQRVEQGLIQPLAEAQQKRSKYSRARISDPQRRVRVERTTLSTDGKGRKFVPFVVDANYGDKWETDAIVGCVYQGSANIYVKIGDDHYPGAFLLGEDVPPTPDACAAAPGKS